MPGTFKSIYRGALVAGLLIFTAVSNAAATQEPVEGERGIKNFLTEHTLVFPDTEGGENLIHFGRFGNFDWYFPCQFESGDWSLADDKTLRLTYHNTDFEARQYTLVRRDDEIVLTEPGSANTTVATLREGNHIPYF